MSKYEGFGPYNVAIPRAKQIGIYDESGSRVGQIPLGNLRLRDTGEKLYSFGVLSDTHAGNSENVNGYFKAAAEYLDSIDEVEFVCICGDLVEDGRNAEHWEIYTDTINDCLKTKPVFAISGNHEQSRYCEDAVKSATGMGVCKSFMHHGDVFIMLGCFAYVTVSANGQTITTNSYLKDDLLKIHKIFETNRNRRCFVFHHVQLKNEFTDYHIDDARSGRHIPLSMFQHYKNVTVFHGHTHAPFNWHLKYSYARNYSEETFGCRSVHVPSISLISSSKTPIGQFYIADVYQNGVHLHGYDMLDDCSSTEVVSDRSKWVVPYASYWIDTRLQNIEANSYHWSTPKATEEG